MRYRLGPFLLGEPSYIPADLPNEKLNTSRQRGSRIMCYKGKDSRCISPSSSSSSVLHGEEAGCCSQASPLLKPIFTIYKAPSPYMYILTCCVVKEEQDFIQRNNPQGDTYVPLLKTLLTSRGLSIRARMEGHGFSWTLVKSPINVRFHGSFSVCDSVG